MKGFGILLLATLVLAEPPYPQSGWQPSGERLRLPIRNLKQQQAPVPHTVYGPPSTEAPVEQPAPEYGAPPQQQPEPEYGAPPAQEPDNGYGPPQEPDNGYGPPQEPENGYGAPQEPDNGFGAPEQPEDGYPQAGYPGGEYGAPPQEPENPEYETPEGSGQLPVDQGASERLRQNQFRQQLPHFEPARFRPQSQRLRQPIRQPIRQQQFKQQPIRQQQFRQQPPRQQPIRQQQQFRPQQQPARFQQSQKLQQQNFRQPQTQNFRQVAQSFDSQRLKPQKQQLYTTTTTRKPSVVTRKAKPARTTTTERAIPEEQGPNIAVATAFSGRYYVLQNDGLLQEVTYKLNDKGKLTDGRITPNLKHEDLAPITDPIYTFNKNQQLVRLN